MRRPVVAGVDGSPGGTGAAQFAAGLAVRREAPLVLMHVFESFFYGYGPIIIAGSYATVEGKLRQAGGEALESTAADIREAYPGLSVETRLRDGVVAATLIEESEEALATVVGSRGTGGFAGLMLGSVSAQLAAHGHGPIVVVRPVADPDAPILVGYDGSEAARAALSYGVREALDQKKRLVVATVYWEEPWGFHPEPAEDPHVTSERKAEALLAEALELHLEAHPELDYDTRVIHSLNAEYSLTEQTSGASLTVVGCRGRGGFAGLLLGSVSRALVHYAAGPVAIIHPSEHE
jgi:nucleotide-binding universal stress UspA family protein